MSEENAPLNRFRFQRMLEMLEKKEGRGTELISVYIPRARRLSTCTQRPLSFFCGAREYSIAEVASYKHRVTGIQPCA